MSITSDWGDWLLRDIDSADPDGIALWYLGCNGFVLKSADGTTVFIDPYLGTGDPPRTVRMIPVPFDPTDVRTADAILATHEHTDHVHGPSQAPILAATGAQFVGPDASIAVARDESWTTEWDVESDQFLTIAESDTLRIGDLTIHVEAANDPDADHPVSYVIEHESGTFFHGGDARPGGFDRIASTYDIDLGALAFGSVGMIRDRETGVPSRTRWYNDENDVIAAANDVQIDRLVPTHWDMWKNLTADPSTLFAHARSFEYPQDIEIVEIGDRLDL